MRARGKVLLRRHLGDIFARWKAKPATEPRLVILMYHAIADAGHDPAQLTVAPRLFAEQMRWLVELGYRVVPLAAAAADLREGRLQSPVVALTFDDGYRSVYTHALPVLAQHGYPATVFLVPDVQARTLVGDGIPSHLGPLLG